MKYSKSLRKINEAICDAVIYNASKNHLKSTVLTVIFSYSPEYKGYAATISRKIEKAVPSSLYRIKVKHWMLDQGYLKKSHFGGCRITSKFWKQIFLPYTSIYLSYEKQIELVSNLKKLKA